MYTVTLSLTIEARDPVDAAEQAAELVVSMDVADLVRAFDVVKGKPS